MSKSIINFARLNRAINETQVCFPYVSRKLTHRLVGWVVRNRNQRKNVMNVLKLALAECQVAPQQQAGYKRAAAEYFNEQVDRKGNLITKTRTK